MLNWRDRRFLALLANTAFACSSFVLGWLLLINGDNQSYGSFAFFILLQSLSYAVINALFGAPLLMASRENLVIPENLKPMLWMLGFLSVLLVASQGVVLYLQNIDVMIIFLLLCSSFLLNLRWFVRTVQQNDQPLLVIITDAIYSLVVVIGVGICYSLGFGLVKIDLLQVSAIMLSAVIVAIIPAIKLLGQIFKAKPTWSVWWHGFHHQGKPALSGVITADLTANCHQYFLMILSGAAGLAPLAAASLFLRPMTLAQASLAQIERPNLARAVFNNETDQIKTKTNTFYRLSAFAFFINILLVLFVFNFFPDLLWPDLNSFDTFILCLLFGSLVAFIRSFRGPASTLLQAYDQFSFLSSVTLKSSLITVPLSFFGILEFGLDGALVAMLVGELLIAVPIIRRTRQLLYVEQGQ